MDILKKNLIDWKEERLIRRLYQGQKIVVTLEKKMTNKKQIVNDVRQSNCIPFILFNS